MQLAAALEKMQKAVANAMILFRSKAGHTNSADVSSVKQLPRDCQPGHAQSHRTNLSHGTSHGNLLRVRQRRDREIGCISSNFVIRETASYKKPAFVGFFVPSEDRKTETGLVGWRRSVVPAGLCGHSLLKGILQGNFEILPFENARETAHCR
jgi:hypothetical protein